MDKYRFEPMTWTDDEDGGSVGKFYGTKVALEAHGYAHDPRWTVVFDNSQYGYERGGRDGERTLADIKAIAEADARGRAESRYERALRTVAVFESRHLPEKDVA